MAIAAPPLPNPLGLIRQRFTRWWQARLPLSDTVTLTQRNVYILPTRPGFMLAGTLLVLLIASINYQLNLGYLLTFLLAGSAVVGMHVCHATLRGLTLHLIALHFLHQEVIHLPKPDLFRPTRNRALCFVHQFGKVLCTELCAYHPESLRVLQVRASQRLGRHGQLLT